MENHEKRPLPEARTYTVEDVAAMLNIGRTSAYTGEGRSLQDRAYWYGNSYFQEVI